MFITILIALLGVLALVINDYVHLKANYKFIDFWLSYIVAFITGAFLFSFLLKWQYFQYAQLLAFVILVGLFSSLIFKFLAGLWSKVTGLFKKKSA